MQNIKTNLVLDHLKSDTRQIILETQLLLQYDPELLTKQPAPGSWSVAQAIEHLNAYGRYYIPAIDKALKAKSYTPSDTYSAGWLGNYFTNSMKPTPDHKIKNKMKAMKNYTPSPDLDSKKVIDEYLGQQQSILALLGDAEKNNLGKIRVAISIAPFIKLKLGDTFRFLIAHEQRHMIQCANAIAALKSFNAATSFGAAYQG
ncbi:MAG: DinB family protein [Flavitalea sp.]